MFYQVREQDADFAVVHIRAIATIIVQAESADADLAREMRRRAVKALLQLSGVLPIQASMPLDHVDTTLTALDHEAAFIRGTEAKGDSEIRRNEVVRRSGDEDIEIFYGDGSGWPVGYKREEKSAEQYREQYGEECDLEAHWRDLITEARQHGVNGLTTDDCVAEGFTRKWVERDHLEISLAATEAEEAEEHGKQIALMTIAAKLSKLMLAAVKRGL